jgi:hypothetical protein
MTISDVSPHGRVTGAATGFACRLSMVMIVMDTQAVSLALPLIVRGAHRGGT